MALSASLFLRQKPDPGDDAATDAVDPTAADDAFRTEPVHRDGSRKNPLLEFAGNDDAPAGPERQNKDDPHITPDDRSDRDNAEGAGVRSAR